MQYIHLSLIRQTMLMLLVMILPGVCFGERTDSLSVFVSVTDGFTGEALYGGRACLKDATTGVVLCDSMDIMERHELDEFSSSAPWTHGATVPRCKAYQVTMVYPGYKGRTMEYKLAKLVYGQKIVAYEMEIFPDAAPDARQLKEVTVTASRIKMVMKGDTIEYNARAFQLAEGSMLDNLIRVLPGAELKENGRIFVNGKFVSELLVNGRDFFKGDPRVALGNLPAYSVNKISVYNRRDKFQPEGAEDKGPLVMDVRLKREYARGLISNYELGGGSGLGGGCWNTKWLARLFAMRFTQVSSIALYASANNVSLDMQPGDKGEWRKTDVASGQLTTKSAGMMFSRDWKEHSTAFTTSLSADRRNRLNETEMLAESYIPGGNTAKSLRVSDKRDATLLKWTGGFKKDCSAARVEVSAAATYDHNTSTVLSQSAEREASGGEVYSRRQADYSRQNLWGANLAARGQFRHGLPVLGNSVKLSGGYNSSRMNLDNNDRVAYRSADIPDLALVRRDWQPSYHYNCGAGATPVSYNSPIGRGASISTYLTYNYEYSYKSGRRELRGQDNPESPSMSETQQWVIDEANSYHTTTAAHSHEISPYFSVQNNVWNFNLSIPMKFLDREIIDRRQVIRQRRRNDFLLLPYLNLNGSFDYGGSSLKVGLNGRVSQEAPELLHMLDVLDSSDPLLLRIGNPELGCATTYRGTAYMEYRRNVRSRRFWLNLSYERKNNVVGMAQFYNRTTGVTTLQPQNVNGNHHCSAVITYSRFIDRTDKLFVSNMLHPAFTRSVDFSTATETLNRLKVNLWELENSFSLRYSSGRVQLAARVDLKWSRQVSLSGVFEPFSYLDVSYGLSGSTPLVWGIDLQTDIMAYCRRGYDDPTMNTTDWVWNLQLSRAFGKRKQWVVKAIGFDLLHQLPNIRRVVNAQGRTETRYNTQPSYAMLTLTYRLDIQPRKNYPR